MGNQAAPISHTRSVTEYSALGMAMLPPLNTFATLRNVFLFACTYDLINFAI